MKRGEEFELQGYELMAVINYVSSNHVAIVVHNNSTHIIVGMAEFEYPRGPLMAGKARLIAMYRYGTPVDAFHLAYERALTMAQGIALGEMSDDA